MRQERRLIEHCRICLALKSTKLNVISYNDFAIADDGAALFSLLLTTISPFYQHFLLRLLYILYQILIF